MKDGGEQERETTALGRKNWGLPHWKRTTILSAQDPVGLCCQSHFEGSQILRDYGDPQTLPAPWPVMDLLSIKSQNHSILELEG